MGEGRRTGGNRALLLDGVKENGRADANWMIPTAGYRILRLKSRMKG